MRLPSQILDVDIDLAATGLGSANEALHLRGTAPEARQGTE
jgi:hypothetical protein